MMSPVKPSQRWPLRGSPDRLCERQHRDRSFREGLNELARSRRQFGRDRQGWPVDLDREHLDRLGDVLQALRSELAHRDAEGVAHRTLHGFRDADPAWLGERLNARRDVDAVTLHIGLAAEQHLADVDADAKGDRLVVGMPHGFVAELALDRYRKLQRLSGALEQRKDAVAGDVLDATAVVADQRSDQPDRLGHPLIGALLVLRHQPAVAVNIGEQDRGKLAAGIVGRFDGHERQLLDHRVCCEARRTLCTFYEKRIIAHCTAGVCPTSEAEPRPHVPSAIGVRRCPAAGARPLPEPAQPLPGDRPLFRAAHRPWLAKGGPAAAGTAALTHFAACARTGAAARPGLTSPR